MQVPAQTVGFEEPKDVANDEALPRLELEQLLLPTPPPFGMGQAFNELAGPFRCIEVKREICSNQIPQEAPTGQANVFPCVNLA